MEVLKSVSVSAVTSFKPPAALGQVWAEHRVPLMAALTAKLGDLDRVEDALSEAVLRAQQSWSAALPANPSGWLYRVALNAARDQQRRTATRTRAEPTVKTHITQPQDDALSVSPEARLQLFARCTDPNLSSEQQIALILYHLAGLDCATIATAFLVKEATIYQRLSRARSKLKSTAVLPEPNPRAIRSALELIYLQSYQEIAGGPEADALGRDALQLVEAFCEVSHSDAETWALAGLLHALEARRAARLDDKGQFVPLDRQDVSKWSAHHLRIAGTAMQKVTALSEQPDVYALRLQIELARMIAKRNGDSADTELLELHDRLIAVSDLPFAKIERALIISRLEGPSAGLSALEVIEMDLSGHAGWHLAKAELHSALQDASQARLHFNAALKLVKGQAERAFIIAKRERIQA